ASALFDLLESQVVPLFYERSGSSVPHGWLRKVKASLASLGPRVTASRMVGDYVERLYEPTAAHADALTADGCARAVALARWKEHVVDEWHGVHVDRVEAVDETGGGDSGDTEEAAGHAGAPAGGQLVDDAVAIAELGGRRTVSAIVALGGLTSDDVDVQLLHGPAGAGEELTEWTAVSMVPVSEADADHARYEGTFACE